MPQLRGNEPILGLNIIVDLLMLFTLQLQVQKGLLCKRGIVFLVICKVEPVLSDTIKMNA
jgi:hypothetical protein